MAKLTGSKKARATSARLFAVQAVYQAIQLGVSPSTLAGEYLEHNVGMNLEGNDFGGAEMVSPDGHLFKSILAGVSSCADDIQAVLQQRVKPESQPESLLQAILVCGIYEILAHQDIDAPIIISDYLNIAHGFYEGAESKLVNAVLDTTAKNIRIP